MKTYSQVGQDLFVLSMFPKGYKGTFVDIGCGLPVLINNTMLLEENGWTGLSIDIFPYNGKWDKVRKTMFFCADALTVNYDIFFKLLKLPKIIDYLSIDVEGEGNRFKTLKRVLEANYNFRVITIEHDVYAGYDLTERQPQRELLNGLGYHLYKPDVTYGGNAFEDWWVNPKFIKNI